MTTALAPSVLIAEATVHSVARVSPAFVRVELSSSGFADLGEEGFDTRFKMIFPGPTGELPVIPAVAEDYYAGWMGAPDETRSPMRTYTVRDIVRDGSDVRLVVDLVVHEDNGHGTGPACRWALAAASGDVLQVIAPHRASSYGGTEFDPAGRRHVLLIGDETAVPALARILADLGPGHTGEVFVEVPTAADILDLPTPTEFEALPDLPSDPSEDGDIDVWETPRYSSAGEDLEEQLSTRSLGHDLDDTYAWIAGESWLVKALRRSLVAELGLERGQVAFMGYWREGVAMRG